VGEVQANVDAGWDANSERTGIGIIIRDHEGGVILSEWKPIHDCMCAEEAEVHAIIAGLEHLIDLRRWPASLESDSLRATRVLTSSDVDRSMSWCLYEEARDLLRIFNHITVSRVGRDSNRAAHSLAQLGKTGVSGVLWGATPICASAVVASESTL
jgi:ribonuclease HI